jgi:hypothetical protein
MPVIKPCVIRGLLRICPAILAVVACGTAATVAAADRSWPEVVESLASMNKAPVIRRQDGRSDTTPEIPAGFNWAEQKRIWQVAHELAKNAEEAWPELVKHLDDRRYALTVEHSVSSVYQDNWTVGDICREIVLWTVMAGYHDEIEWSTKGFYQRMSGEHFTGGVELKKWCEARLDKPLFELQAEACRWAADELAGPQKKRQEPSKSTARSIAKVTARRNKLLETKAPARSLAFRGEFLKPYRQ